MFKALLKFSAQAVVVALSVLSSSAHAQLADPNTALTEYVNRTSLAKGDVTNFATSLPLLIGAYITMENGVFKLEGHGKGDAAKPAQFDLKNRPVFHQLITNSQKVSVSVLNMFSISRDKQYADELTITDLISLNDTAFNGDKCAAERPASFTATTKYWCISAITLSNVITRRLHKVRNVGTGNYGVVTAEGTFESAFDSQGSILTASITPLGPYVNGVRVEIEPAKTLTMEALPKKDGSMLKAMPTWNPEKPSGLEGMILGVVSPN